MVTLDVPPRSDPQQDHVPRRDRRGNGLLAVDRPDLRRRGPRSWLSAHVPGRADGRCASRHVDQRARLYSGQKELDHACRNRLCVRPHPDHLELVTRKRNAIRREQAKRGMIGHNGGPQLVCEEA